MGRVPLPSTGAHPRAEGLQRCVRRQAAGQGGVADQLVDDRLLLGQVAVAVEGRTQLGQPARRAPAHQPVAQAPLGGPGPDGIGQIGEDPPVAAGLTGRRDGLVGEHHLQGVRDRVLEVDPLGLVGRGQHDVGVHGRPSSCAARSPPPSTAWARGARAAGGPRPGCGAARWWRPRSAPGVLCQVRAGASAPTRRPTPPRTRGTGAASRPSRPARRSPGSRRGRATARRGGGGPAHGGHGHELPDPRAGQRRRARHHPPRRPRRWPASIWTTISAASIPGPGLRLWR